MLKWIKNLFRETLEADEGDLTVNTNEFTTTLARHEKKNYIVCNEEEVEIMWDKVIRFDDGGPGYKTTNYYRRNHRTPKMFVVHWDACLNTKQMIKVTKERGLSVHFGIDNDGTIYQLLDTKDIAWHAAGINTQSIGVEISNPVLLRYNKRNRERGEEEREVIYGDKIHNKLIKPYLGFYPVQIEALKRLTEALSTTGIKMQAPLDEEGRLRRGVDKRVANGTFEGVVGHYHLTTNKRDPGNLPLDKIVREVQK